MTIAVATQQPGKYRLVEWMYKINLREYFTVGLSGRYISRHYQNLFDVVKKSEELYQSRFRNNQFYGLIFPGQPMAPVLKELFQQAGIQLLDYANLLNASSYMLPFDSSHPNGEAYRRVTEKLAKDLQL